jgi:O-succinylbenzoic acid--CoA ligase
MSAPSLPSDWMRAAAASEGARAALIVDSAELSFDTLYTRTRALAVDAESLGLRPGAAFAVISDRSEHIAWALYLALHIGSPLWPLDPRRADLREALTGSGIHRVWTDRGRELSPELSRLAAGRLGGESSQGGPEPRPVSGDRVQLIVATSGSTGSPRGVMLSAAGLAAAVTAARERLDLRPGDCWLACLPLFHVGGLSILLRTLQARACTLLHPGFDAGRVWTDLHAHSVTHVSLASPMLEALLGVADGAPPPPSLRVALLGGGPIDPTLMSRALDQGWPICPSYGLSEAGSQVATLCPAEPGWEVGDAGMPLDGVGVEIVDDAGHPTKGPGRIRITGPTLMAGYLNPRLEPGDGLVEGGYTSSDLGVLDRRCRLRVLGRVDDVIVSGGENVMPQQVETLLLACAGVDEVAVIGTPDPTWGQRVTAVFAGALDAAGLEQWCRANIPSPLRPRAFLRLDRLPRNAMGKPDRPALRRLAENPAG